MHISTAITKKQHGLALVEFSIMLPLLLLLLLSIAEFGRLFLHYGELVKTTRDAARVLAEMAIPGTSGLTIITPELIGKTTNLVVYGNEIGSGPVLVPGITADGVTVSQSSTGHVRVAVSYQYTPILFNALPLFQQGESVNLGFTLTSSCNMRAF